MLWAIGICVPWPWAEQLPDAFATSARQRKGRIQSWSALQRRILRAWFLNASGSEASYMSTFEESAKHTVSTVLSTIALLLMISVFA